MKTQIELLQEEIETLKMENRNLKDKCEYLRKRVDHIGFYCAGNAGMENISQFAIDTLNQSK